LLAFVRNDSPTCAGGVGFYIKNNMQYRLRTELSLNIQQCEDLWLEIETRNSKIVLAVIYRHPSKEILTFQEKFCEILST